jgi:nicotinamide-nucleotide amidase
MSTLTHLANEVIQCAKAKDLMVCTAESCSAGKLAMVLSKAESASMNFMGGIVAYTKETKTRLLAVPPDLIQRDTAVSAKVAEAMALGAIRRFNADLGVSITGVAGPEPDEDGNPVGLVYCAVARSEITHFVELRCKSAKPDEIIDEACAEALKLLRSFCLRSITTDFESCEG